MKHKSLLCAIASCICVVQAVNAADHTSQNAETRNPLCLDGTVKEIVLTPIADLLTADYSVRLVIAANNVFASPSGNATECVVRSYAYVPEIATNITSILSMDGIIGFAAASEADGTANVVCSLGQVIACYIPRCSVTNATAQASNMVNRLRHTIIRGHTGRSLLRHIYPQAPFGDVEKTLQSEEEGVRGQSSR